MTAPTPELRSFGVGQEAACHYPLERWPLTNEEIRRRPDAIAR